MLYFISRVFLEIENKISMQTAHLRMKCGSDLKVIVVAGVSAACSMKVTRSEATGLIVVGSGGSFLWSDCASSEEL